MGMPITITVADPRVTSGDFVRIFDYFRSVDQQFSTYRDTSEISKINRHELEPSNYSPDMAMILALCEETKRDSGGWFDIKTPGGALDPSGLVKGWAIYQAAQLLVKNGWPNFCVEAGGDIEARGRNAAGEPWRVGIRNPLSAPRVEVVKVLAVTDRGVATSGTYLRGQHIYNPKAPGQTITDIVSLTVVGPNIYEADRFATAAFAMGRNGINFIEQRPNLEGYMIDRAGQATMTTGFPAYVAAA